MIMKYSFKLDILLMQCVSRLCQVCVLVVDVQGTMTIVRCCIELYIVNIFYNRLRVFYCEIY